MHTPMFMWWNGKLKTGDYDKLVSSMDFYPTALDAADIKIPASLKLDGVSLLPYVQKGADKKSAAGEPHKYLSGLPLILTGGTKRTLHSGTDIINS